MSLSKVQSSKQSTTNGLEITTLGRGIKPGESKPTEPTAALFGFATVDVRISRTHKI